MARRADDATMLLRMSKDERELVNRAFGRGNVNMAAVRLLIEAARSRLADQPGLDQLSLDQMEGSAA